MLVVLSLDYTCRKNQVIGTLRFTERQRDDNVLRQTVN